MCSPHDPGSGAAARCRPFIVPQPFEVSAGSVIEVVPPQTAGKPAPTGCPHPRRPPCRYLDGFLAPWQVSGCSPYRSADGCLGMKLAAAFSVQPRSARNVLMNKMTLTPPAVQPSLSISLTSGLAAPAEARRRVLSAIE